MTKKVHFKFYLFGERELYWASYEMFDDNVIITSDSTGNFNTAQYALYIAQQKVVEFIDILNKIGTVPINYTYSMGRNFSDAK